MRIGIDISQIVFEGTGVATYTRKLVENLLGEDKKNEYILFGSSLRQQKALHEFTKAKKVIVPIPPTLLSLLWNDMHIVPVEMFTGKVDVIHSSDWTQPPTAAKKVTTIHDLVVYKFPESSHSQIVTTQKKRLDWVKKECDLIIVDSKSTLNDCHGVLGIPKEKMRVVYLSAGQEYIVFNEQNTVLRKQAVDRVKNKYSLGRKYIFAVGTREPRKNLERLMESFETIGNQDIQLIVAGKLGWGSQTEKKNVRLLGFVPKEDLPALYAGAEVFAYPSLYEGFGIPILEAMTVGCPVLTSNCSSMPEVGGEAGLYVDPQSTNKIAEMIKKIINLDESEYRRMKENCLKQAAKFSWEKTARETLKVYEELEN